MPIFPDDEVVWGVLLLQIVVPPPPPELICNRLLTSFDVDTELVTEIGDEVSLRPPTLTLSPLLWVSLLLLMTELVVPCKIDSMLNDFAPPGGLALVVSPWGDVEMGGDPEWNNWELVEMKGKRLKQVEGIFSIS